MGINGGITIFTGKVALVEPDENLRDSDVNPFSLD
jgi:hypothetical protein